MTNIPSLQNQLKVHPAAHSSYCCAAFLSLCSGAVVEVAAPLSTCSAAHEQMLLLFSSPPPPSSTTACARGATPAFVHGRDARAWRITCNCRAVSSPRKVSHLPALVSHDSAHPIVLHEFQQPRVHLHSRGHRGADTMSKSPLVSNRRAALRGCVTNAMSRGLLLLMRAAVSYSRGTAPRSDVWHVPHVGHAARRGCVRGHHQPRAASSNALIDEGLLGASTSTPARQVVVGRARPLWPPRAGPPRRL